MKPADLLSKPTRLLNDRDLRRTRQAGIRELLGIGQIAQGLHPEGGKEGLGRDKGVGRASSGLPGACADQVALGQVGRSGHG